jgi:hypothetical protein
LCGHVDAPLHQIIDEAVALLSAVTCGSSSTALSRSTAAAVCVEELQPAIVCVVVDSGMNE